MKKKSIVCILSAAVAAIAATNGAKTSAKVGRPEKERSMLLIDRINMAVRANAISEKKKHLTRTRARVIACLVEWYFNR